MRNPLKKKENRKEEEEEEGLFLFRVFYVVAGEASGTPEGSATKRPNPYSTKLTYRSTQRR